MQITKKVSEEEEQKLDNGKKELSDILSRKYRSDIYEYERSTAGNRNPADVGSVYMVMTGAAFGMLAFFRTGIRNSQMGRSDRRITSDKEHI